MRLTRNHASRCARSRCQFGDQADARSRLERFVLSYRLKGQRLQSVDLDTHLRRRRTYPGFFPILHLDHIYFEGQVEVLRVALPKDRMAKMASDHLPLVADLRIGFES